MLTTAKLKSKSKDIELLEPLLKPPSLTEQFAEPSQEKKSDQIESITTLLPTRPSPSAPHNDNDAKSDAVRYLDPQFRTFDELEPNNFILAPQTNKDFISWAKDRKEDWIRHPNAESDRDLLLAINGEIPEDTAGRKFLVTASVILSTPFTLGKYAYDSTRTLNPGEIHFTNNAGKQEIRLEMSSKPAIHYLASVRHAWGKKYSASENFIQEGNVTIVRILPWEVGLAIDNGKPAILLPGRHAFNSAVFKLEQAKIVNISSPLLQSGNLSIVRVMANEIGLAEEYGNNLLLLPGVHVRQSVTFKLNSTYKTRETLQPEDKRTQLELKSSCLSHGTISIVQVDKDKLGAGMVGTEPVLMRSGIHIINSQAFKFAQFFNANAGHIAFSTINIIRVRRGEIALGEDSGLLQAVVLEEGEHPLNSRYFKFDSFKSLTEKRITFRNYTRVQVNAGEYGYAWENGEAKELKPGVHVSKDPLFVFSQFRNANDEVIQFGNLAHITVKAGEARAVWEAGKLKVLREGQYDFTSPTLVVDAATISLQNVIHTMHDVLVKTQDRMPMHVTGQIVYRVVDPEKLLTSLTREETKALNTTIEKRATANLREQFSHVDLSMISPDHHQHEHGEEKVDNRLFGNKTKGEGDDLRGQLCTKVMGKLSKDAEKWGIQIVDFEMLDVGCQKKEVEDSLADATAKTRQAEAKYDLQKAENATIMIREKADVDRELMKEKKKAEISKIHIDAETQANFTKIEQEAQARAKAKEIETKANADALIKQAQAEMEAAKLKAEGLEALNAAQRKLLDHPGYIELEKAKLQVEAEKYRAQKRTPLVSFKGKAAKKSAESMFLGDGTNLVKLALKQQGPYRHAPESPKPNVKEVKNTLL